MSDVKLKRDKNAVIVVDNASLQNYKKAKTALRDKDNKINTLEKSLKSLEERFNRLEELLTR